MQLQRKREKRALDIIARCILVIIAIIVVISTVSFIRGKYEKYNETLSEYEAELKGEYNFTNIEELQFLNTEGVIEYQNYVREIIQSDAIENVTSITVLDTITNNAESGTYEWFITLDDKNNTTYKNIYTPSAVNDNVGAFTMSQFDVAEIMDDTENEAISIKEDAISENESDYIDGTLDDITGILPTIENIGLVTKYIDDEDGVTLSNKLRVFLVESNNNRRLFTITQSGIENKEDRYTFIIKAKITLSQNNTIRAVYNKASKAFTFEYTD